MRLSAAGDGVDHRIEAMALRAELDEIVRLWRLVRKNEISAEQFFDFMEDNFETEDES